MGIEGSIQKYSLKALRLLKTIEYFGDIKQKSLEEPVSSTAIRKEIHRRKDGLIRLLVIQVRA